MHFPHLPAVIHPTHFFVYKRLRHLGFPVLGVQGLSYAVVRTKVALYPSKRALHGCHALLAFPNDRCLRVCKSLRGRDIFRKNGRQTFSACVRSKGSVLGVGLWGAQRLRRLCAQAPLQHWDTVCCTGAPVAYEIHCWLR